MKHGCDIDIIKKSVFTALLRFADQRSIIARRIRLFNRAIRMVIIICLVHNSPRHVQIRTIRVTMRRRLYL